METDPLYGSAFFGREDLLQVLDKRVQSFAQGYRQNLALIGQKSVGTSSVIRHFLFQLDQPGLIPIYVEVLPEPFDYFAQKFMGSLLAAFLKGKTGEIPTEFNQLIVKTRRDLPKTLQKMRRIKRLLDEEAWDRAFHELLTLTQLLQEETGKKVLLVLDNIDMLEELLLSNPFHAFGNAIMVQTETLYLVTVSRLRKAQVIFREKLSLLFGNFEILELKPFDFQTASTFLQVRLPAVEISDPIRKFIVELTDGHPYFLATLTESLKPFLDHQNKKVLSDTDLAQVLELQLYRRNGCLHQYFVMLLQKLGKERTLYASLKVLLALSLGYKKIPQIARYLHRKNDEIQKALSRLFEEELVDKKGSFYSISFPLFGFWLRHVYYRRELDFIQKENASAELFLKQVVDLIGERVEEEKKDLPKRVEELFRKFENDVIEIEDRKVKCPHFSEVYFKPPNGRVFPVEAKNSATRWLCQVAYKKVTEDDVRVFVQDIQKLRKPVQRKIMITLKGIELNATLLAKEAKMTLWSLKDFNELLDLYSRPKVIV